MTFCSIIIAVCAVGKTLMFRYVDDTNEDMWRPCPDFLLGNTDFIYLFIPSPSSLFLSKFKNIELKWQMTVDSMSDRKMWGKQKTWPQRYRILFRIFWHNSVTMSETSFCILGKPIECQLHRSMAQNMFTTNSSNNVKSFPFIYFDV